MTKLTIARAAKIAEIERSTLYRKNKKGEISFEKNERGFDVIDLSELLRVYPYIKIKEETLSQAPMPQSPPEQQPTTHFRNELLQQKVIFLQQRIEDKEKELRESKEREKNMLGKLDKAQLTIDNQILLIKNYTYRGSENQNEKTFFQRLFFGNKAR